MNNVKKLESMLLACVTRTSPKSKLLHPSIVKNLKIIKNEMKRAHKILSHQSDKKYNN